MDTKEAIGEIKKELSILKETGQQAVDIDALGNYLSALEQKTGISMEQLKQQNSLNLAHYTATNAAKLAEYNAEVQNDLEMFKSVIQAGKEALNATLLINGGAAVAILGFLGSVAVKGDVKALALALTCPLQSFGGGVLFGALGFGVRYCSQFIYAHKKMRCLGHVFNILASLLAACSYGAFGYGVYLVYRAFQAHFGTP